MPKVQHYKMTLLSLMLKMYMYMNPNEQMCKDAVANKHEIIIFKMFG